MAFGMQVSTGNFRPIVKYDARSGRMFVVNKDASGVNTQTEMPNGAQFAVDFGSLEVGYVEFSANGPIRAMVPYGSPLPQQPHNKDDKGKLLARPGFFLLVAGQSVGGVVREWCSNAASLLTAVDELWQVFARAPEAATGKIPLVSILSTTPVTTGSGAQKSTNYRPLFQITGWVDRIADMGDRTVPPPSPQAQPAFVAPAAQMPAAQNGHVPPPAAIQAAQAAQAAQVQSDAMPF